MMRFAILPTCFKAGALFFLLTSLLFITSANAEQAKINANDKEAIFERDYLFPNYPTDVPYFPVRRNPYNLSEEVSRGRLHLIGGLPKKRIIQKQVSMQEFKRALQCSLSEPSMDEFYGTLSLMRLYPPTKEMVELFCAWAETRCYNSRDNDWASCKAIVKEYKAGKYPEQFGMFNFNMFASFRLIRIIKGELYYDWPWGIERVPRLQQFGKIYDPLLYVINGVRDIKDAIFGFGGEHVTAPWKMPFPLVASVGHYAEDDYGTNTILWPWEQEFRYEEELHNKLIEAGRNDYSDESYRTLLKIPSWKKKDPRAAFYASYDDIRVVLLEQTARHPELFDLQVYFSIGLRCWAPGCTRDTWDISNLTALGELAKQPSSHNLSGLAVSQYKSTGKPYKVGGYKYIVVPLGLKGRSTSSRILYLLAHCRCVLLFTNSHLQYHFSAHLKPWVHYVPLSYSGADVVAKVKWLRAHDDIARKIAINGYNFGRSFLRLEDYLCYAATVVDTIGMIMENTTALEPFHPINIMHVPQSGAAGYGGYRV